MTREEAIKIIDCYDIGFCDLCGKKIPADKLADAFDMAIEALSADTVSREAIMSAKFHPYPFTHITPTDVDAEAYKRGWNDALDAVADNAPIVDAVEVVRCNDCKHKVTTEDGEYDPEDIVCNYWMSDGLTEKDFCSYGERKDNEINRRRRTKSKMVQDKRY